MGEPFERRDQTSYQGFRQAAQQSWRNRNQETMMTNDSLPEITSDDTAFVECAENLRNIFVLKNGVNEFILNEARAEEIIRYVLALP